MKQNRKYGLLFIFIILVFMVSEAVASRTHMNYKLEYLNNKLSVNVEKVTLGSVLAKIQEKTGIKFLFDKEESDRIISVKFQSLAIENALKRILNNLNHAVIFGPDYNIQKVIIVGKSMMPLASHVHEDKTLPSSNAMFIEAPVQEGMKITHSSDAMVIEPGGEGMKITYDGEPMKITHSSDKMQITHSPDLNLR